MVLLPVSGVRSPSTTVREEGGMEGRTATVPCSPALSSTAASRGTERGDGVRSPWPWRGSVDCRPSSAWFLSAAGSSDAATLTEDAVSDWLEELVGRAGEDRDPLVDVMGESGLTETGLASTGATTTSSRSCCCCCRVTETRM